MVYRGSARPNFFADTTYSARDNMKLCIGLLFADLENSNIHIMKIRQKIAGVGRGLKEKLLMTLQI